LRNSGGETLYEWSADERGGVKLKAGVFMVYDRLPLPIVLGLKCEGCKNYNKFWIKRKKISVGNIVRSAYGVTTVTCPTLLGILAFPSRHALLTHQPMHYLPFSL
jgi:hypothetical protein